MKKLKKYIIITVSALIIISGALAGTIYHFVKGGIAQYSGTVELPGLSAPVTIERDSYGIPTIKASNRADITRAIGFTHGQERFFQMDLLRRKSAGELSELVGKKALPLDKKQRFHQFRKRMQKNFEMMPEAERKDLIAYAEGVNAGVKALSKKPWEYYLLGGTPREWMPEDSMLVGIVMFQELQDSTGEFDLSRGYMEKLLPPDVYEFFVNNGSAWQATLDESITPMKPIPGEESFSYLYKRGLTEEEQFPEIMPIGSNNWVMDGSHTGGQGAIVACDMHLSHSVPNVWYRAHFEYYNDKGEEIVVDGVTLPGAPPIVLGSNGNVAWGLTASEINATDIVIIEETEPGYYKTPDGVMAYEKDTEIINIKGGKTAECDVINTIWGPVLDKTFFGKPVALKWVAHELLSVNMKLVLFEDCVTAEEALEKSKNVRTPALNLVVGDSEGNIGWTLIGYVPKRKGYEGNIPVSFADGTASWEGCLDAEEYPIIYNPSSGILWTANNRTLGNEWTGLLGDGGYFSSARAYQIKDKLFSMKHATAAQMLALQLDDEAYFLRRWQGVVLEILGTEEAQRDPVKHDLEAIIARWDGHASIDSTAYFVIRTFRANAKKAMLQRAFAPCIAAWEDFNSYRLDYEEPLWMIIDNKPEYLHGAEYGSWDEELMAYLDNVINQCRDEKGNILWDSKKWGKVNKLKLRHPLSGAVPFIGHWLDFPDDPISGDSETPKVSSPTKGASQRMAVVVGNEKTAIFHHPCGQSGNPLSPYYRKGHEDWVLGNPSPLLPGKTEHSLTLQ